ncbi:glycosyltransferase [Rickettsiales bacterium LUAb2]
MNKLKLCFIIGSSDISGGTSVIFNHCLFLKQLGHDVDIITIFPSNNTNWHRAFNKLKFITLEEASTKAYDICVATYFATVSYLTHIKAAQYMYFIQSIESLFNFNIKDIMIAQLTYSLNLPFISVASWITKYLSDNYNSSGITVLNGIDKNIFTADGDTFSNIEKKGNLRILVEGQLNRFTKNVNSTLATLQKSKAKDIWLATINKISSYKGCSRVFSNVTQTEMAKLYRSCDVLIKISYVEGMFGPPLEMFHCGGTAIVNKVSGYDEYIIKDSNALVVNNDQELIQAVNTLYNDPQHLTKLKENAIVTAQKWPSIEDSARNFYDGMLNILNQKPYDISIVKRFNKQIQDTCNLYDFSRKVNSKKIYIPTQENKKKHKLKLLNDLKQKINL